MKGTDQCSLDGDGSPQGLGIPVKTFLTSEHANDFELLIHPALESGMGLIYEHNF